MVLYGKERSVKTKWECCFRLASAIACTHGVRPRKAKLDGMIPQYKTQSQLPPVLVNGLERKKDWRRSRGFTLTEMLLTISLMAIFMGATVFTFSTLGPSSRLEDGTAQFESLVRFARAYAANSGKQVQISFAGTAPESYQTNSQVVRLEWEPDPLGQPGHFEEIPETVHYTQGLEDLVQIRSVAIRVAGQLDDPAVASSDELLFSLEIPTLPPLVFYPDGSCDSAEILVGSQAEEDTRQMSIQIVGFTGSITHKILDIDGISDEEVIYEPIQEDESTPQTTVADDTLSMQGL